MEVIIVVAVLVGVALFWVSHVKAEKSKTDNALDNWTPPKAEDKPWPYGEKVAEGKVHVKPADVAPKAAVEVSAASMTLELKSPMDVAVEQLAAKKAPAKKRQSVKKTAEPAVPAKAATKKGAHEGNKAPAKRAPKKKSV
jgi:hypothetical protein